MSPNKCGFAVSVIIAVILLAVIRACADPLPHTVIYIVLGHSNGENFFARGGADAFAASMRARYPAYNFVIDKAAFSSTWVNEMKPGSDKYALVQRYIRNKPDSAVIGGIICFYGFMEGKDSAAAWNLTAEYERLRDLIRRDANNPRLPFLIDRHEHNKNNTNGQEAEYSKYADVVENVIERLEYDKYTIAFPIRFIPKEGYIENHHYSEIGHKICAQDMAALIQLNNLDFWNTGN